MNRLLWLLNVVLAAALVALLVGLTDTLVNHEPSTAASRHADASTESAGQLHASEPSGVAAQPAIPPLSEYAILVQKDVFKTAVVEPVSVPTARKPPPPPVPLPALIGTVFVGDERKAVLRDGKRTEIFEIGEEVAGGKLVRIEPDRVVIQRGDAQVEVSLKASIQSVSPPGAAGTAALPPEGGSAHEGSASEAAPGVTPSPSTPQVTQEGSPTVLEKPTIDERLRNLRQTFQNRRKYLPVR